MPSYNIPVSELHDLLTYDPLMGVLRWKASAGNRASGQEACAKEAKGYIRISIGKRRLKAHAVAWAMFYGQWPELQVDHINRDPSDNRISNLRLATNLQNCANKRIYRNNTSGAKGVSQRSSGRWQAYIKVNYRRIHLGTFDTKEEARAAYQKAAHSAFGEFANLTQEDHQ